MVRHVLVAEEALSADAASSAFSVLGLVSTAEHAQYVRPAKTPTQLDADPVVSEMEAREAISQLDAEEAIKGIPPDDIALAGAALVSLGSNHKAPKLTNAAPASAMSSGRMP